MNTKLEPLSNKNPEPNFILLNRPSDAVWRTRRDAAAAGGAAGAVRLGDQAVHTVRPGPVGPDLVRGLQRGPQAVQDVKRDLVRDGEGLVERIRSNYHQRFCFILVYFNQPRLLATIQRFPESCLANKMPFKSNNNTSSVKIITRADLNDARSA